MLYRMLPLIILSLIILPSCVNHQNTVCPEGIEQDFIGAWRTVSVRVNRGEFIKNEHPDFDFYEVAVKLTYARLQSGGWSNIPAIGVEPNKWAEVGHINSQPSNQNVDYEIKLLLDDEVVTATLHGRGMILKVKVIPYTGSDRVRVKGLICTIAGRGREIYPINADCVLNQETVIFEDKIKPFVPLDKQE